LVTNNFLARQYAPDGAVRQYLAALQSGDANAAWNVIQVSPPAAAATVSLTDQAALKAALTTGKADIKSFSITAATNRDANSASVDVTYVTSAGTTQAKFLVLHSGQTYFAIYPGWRVAIRPSLLQVNLPPGTSGITVDGRSVALPAGKSTVALLPLPHRIQVNGNALFATQTVSVDAMAAEAQDLSYEPTLSDAGLAKVKAAVKAAFAICSQQTESYHVPDRGCPQSSGTSAGSGQWSIVGDPTADLAVRFDQDLNATAIGHYQMVFSYQQNGTERVPDANAYTAPLTLTGSDASVASIMSTKDGIPALTRPAQATDETVKALVAKAFTQCAAARVSELANCPEQLVDVDVSGVHWSLGSDPLASGAVTFDPSTGLFTVRGSYAMTASYNSFGIAKTQGSLTTSYEAYLLWDGQALQLVSIVGVD
jgi:hypothetical protein